MRNKRNPLNWASLTALCVLTSALVLASATHAQQADSQPAIVNASVALPSPAVDERYHIGAGDLLDIRVFNRPQLSRDSVRVEGNGMIRMPLVEGEIQAACKSEGELAKEIASRYLKYYRNPQVDVFIKEYHAREVAVMGAINEQGRYQMQRRIRLLQLLTYAKGPSDKAGQVINIIRGPRSELCQQSATEAGDPVGFISLRLTDTMRGDEKSNPYMQPGDIVTLPEADQIYVIGNVYGPRSFPLKDPITVSRAIAMAGGPLRDSKTDRIQIVRQKPGAGESELYVNLKAINKKQAEDIQLQPNDIVVVSESASKSLIRSLLGAVAPSVGQLPVRIIP